MKIKKNDLVQVMTGKDKGKKAKVLKAFPKDLMVLVEGINMHKKHQRATKSGSKGQTISISAPIHVSNVMLVDSNGDPVRTGKKLIGEKYVRVSRKSGKEI